VTDKTSPDLDTGNG